MLTYGLLGTFMAIVRPVAALITSATAGLLANAVDNGDDQKTLDQAEPCSVCGSDNCAGGHSYLQRTKASMKYVFVELLGDIGGWILLGIVLSGLIMAFVPEGFFADYLGPDWVTMLLMLVIGLPLYICASGSTPIAAALMLKGVSPGAALVLLMVGPATNLATMMIVSRELGKKSAVIYLGSIIVCSLLIAVGVDALAAMYNFDFTGSFVPGEHTLPVWLGFSSGAILLFFILNHYRKKYFSRKKSNGCGCSCECEK